MDITEYRGLSKNEVEEKRRVFGFNEISIQKDSIINLLIRQFTSSIILLLVFACFVSFLTNDYVVGFAILIIVIVNAVLGLYQEYKSIITLDKLKSFIPSEASVYRDSALKFIDKKELVPGDIIWLKLGDIVPADCILLEQENLTIDESIITGESAIVLKKNVTDERNPDKNNTLFSGTYLKTGSAIGQVIATGIRSKFGKITKITSSIKKVTAYEETVKKISQGFIWTGIIFFVVIFIAQLVVARNENFIDILLFALALVITIVPESLPIVTNLALSKRAYSLAKKGVIVKRPSSIEDLGNIDLLCTDKTGTLTKNILVVSDLQSEDKKFLNYLFLSSYQSEDPFDKAIQNFLNNKNFEREDALLKNDAPFNPDLKYSERVFEKFIIRKGAPEIILKNCEVKKENLINKVKRLESEGLRALAFALINKKKCKYLGTLFFVDEIKEDVEEIILKAKENNVLIKVITGDSFEVAKSVAVKTKIMDKEEDAILADELDFDDLENLSSQVEKYKVFARTDPEQKYKIISALQKKHHIGYLGDGINDAPSLKLANVGIVVDSASEIARESADIVLTRKDLNVIIEGVIDGREVFENIDEYVKHTFTSNVGNFFTIGVFSLFLNYLPMLPIQILISNLLTDIPTLALANDSVERDQLKRPKHYDMKWIMKFSLTLGVFSALFNLIFFWLVKNYSSGIIQAGWLLFSTLTDILIIFSIRSNKIFYKSVKPSLLLVIFSFFSIFISISIALFGVRSLKTEALAPSLIMLIISLAFFYFLFAESIKVVLLKVIGRNN